MMQTTKYWRDGCAAAEAFIWSSSIRLNFVWFVKLSSGAFVIERSLGARFALELDLRMHQMSARQTDPSARYVNFGWWHAERRTWRRYVECLCDQWEPPSGNRKSGRPLRF
mmetsp:Transcript_25373/g.68029  ORF Transcript_25373/g.68029 Transcript_25373/m.68029 type:complete len:111 (+) Transcript_25373:76-408(+)